MIYIFSSCGSLTMIILINCRVKHFNEENPKKIKIADDDELLQECFSTLLLFFIQHEFKYVIKSDKLLKITFLNFMFHCHERISPFFSLLFINIT